MTFAQWKAQYWQMVARAERIRWSRHARANALANQAGLDIARNVWHNAMIDKNRGRPWEGVNYSLLRQAIREDTRMFEGFEIATRWSNRVWPTISR